jgi:integrase
MKRTKLSLTETSIKGETYWLVTIPKLGGGRQKRHFKDFSEAEKFYEETEELLLNQGAVAMAISDRLRIEALEGQRILEPYGVTIPDAARFYAKHVEAQKKSRPLRDAISDYIAGAQSDGRSARYIGDLSHRLGRFVETFNSRLIASFTTDEVEEWLRSLRKRQKGKPTDQKAALVGPVSRNTYRRRLMSFFEFAVERKWCSENPIRHVTKAREKPEAIGILKPEEFAKLLEQATVKTLPYWAIGGFAGLRSAELERLEWRDIHFDRGLIEVTASKAKTAQRRFVDIQPALAQWLEPYRGEHGKICPVNLRRLLLDDRELTGLSRWPSNALRHSFASYHLCQFENAPKTVLQLGHTSAAIVFAHYRELVTPEAAAKFWRIVPAHASTIVRLAASA